MKTADLQTKVLLKCQMKNVKLKTVFSTLQIILKWNQIKPPKGDMLWTVECHISPMIISVEDNFFTTASSPNIDLRIAQSVKPR